MHVVHGEWCVAYRPTLSEHHNNEYYTPKCPIKLTARIIYTPSDDPLRLSLPSAAGLPCVLLGELAGEDGHIFCCFAASSNLVSCLAAAIMVRHTLPHPGASHRHTHNGGVTQQQPNVTCRNAEKRRTSRNTNETASVLVGPILCLAVYEAASCLWGYSAIFCTVDLASAPWYTPTKSSRVQAETTRPQSQTQSCLCHGFTPALCDTDPCRIRATVAGLDLP